MLHCFHAYSIGKSSEDRGFYVFYLRAIKWKYNIVLIYSLSHTLPLSRPLSQPLSIISRSFDDAVKQGQAEAAAEAAKGSGDDDVVGKDDGKCDD